MKWSAHSYTSSCLKSEPDPVCSYVPDLSPASHPVRVSAAAPPAPTVRRINAEPVAWPVRHPLTHQLGPRETDTVRWWKQTGARWACSESVMTCDAWRAVVGTGGAPEPAQARRAAQRGWLGRVPVQRAGGGQKEVRLE